MAVLQSSVTGVVVSVSDATAERLSDEWVPVKEKPTSKSGK